MRTGTAFFKPVLRAPIPRPILRGHARSGAKSVAETCPTRENRPSSIIDCAAYLDGHRVNTTSIKDAMYLVRSEEPHARNGFAWVGLHEPDATELEELAEVFGLHPLAVEDAVHAHQRPKLERYEGVTFVVFKTCRYLEHDRLTSTSDVIETGEIMVFLGEDFVVTVRHGDHGTLRPVRRSLEENPELLAMGPAAVLHAIADQVVDDYLTVADGVQGDIDEVETSVFTPDRTNEVERIYHLKREIIELKRAVAPLSAPLRQLITRPIVPADIREYFRNVEDHLTRVRDHVSSFDELLSSILQAHLAQVTVADNKDMRKISAWAAIFAVPTAATGVYGMNFQYMPELHWRFGYPMVIAVIAMMCFLLYRGFRRNGWL
ncbi:MAG TPA: magnesium/cobalt transporter CorA [Streptosporangiaceae bacterium]